jgi:hypothetical protein
MVLLKALEVILVFAGGLAFVTGAISLGKT